MILWVGYVKNASRSYPLLPMKRGRAKMTIKPWDLDPTLMMHPGLNIIIAKANEHLENAPKNLMKRRREMGQTTCLFHTVLNQFLDEATIISMKKGKPVYSEKRYLGNIIINYLPEKNVWKITITNGGNKRKNAIIQLKVKETLYLRHTNGVYWVDSTLYTEKR